MDTKDYILFFLVILTIIILILLSVTLSAVKKIPLETENKINEEVQKFFYLTGKKIDQLIDLLDTKKTQPQPQQVVVRVSESSKNTK